MSDESGDRHRSYVVLAPVEAAGGKYRDRKLAPYGEPFLATYRQVYGPAGERDCEKWMAANCGEPGEANS